MQNSMCSVLFIEDTGRKGIVVSIEAFSRHVKTLHEDANHGFEDEFKVSGSLNVKMNMS